ncbi:hypothetical protein ABTM21_20265, partial [Acinetobacter baumannii]
VRITVTVLGLCFAGLMFGFALFAVSVMRERPPVDALADGIIVLTGGDHRIQEGGRLLAQHRASRMLISGVNAKTSRDD